MSIVNWVQEVPCTPIFLYQKWENPVNITLEVDKLEQVLQIVSQRHRMLQTILVWKNLREPVQVICKKLKFDFVYYDLTSTSPGEKTPEVNELLQQDWKKAFDRNNSSPLRIGFFKLKENLFQYYLLGDYMRMEGWSTTGFAHEILSLYEIMQTGGNIDLPPHVNCYKEYLHTLRVLRTQEDNPARRYWESIYKDFKGMKSLTSIQGNQKGTGTGFGVSYFYLSPEKTARMEQFLMKYRLSLSPLIQGTWAALLGIYLRQDRILYGMMTTYNRGNNEESQ